MQMITWKRTSTLALCLCSFEGLSREHLACPMRYSPMTTDESQDFFYRLLHRPRGPVQ